jgi:threonine dehydrogenase-like Zn-dependent dehydrogenase
MQGVVFLGSRQLEFQSFPDPVPGPGEAVIEVKTSGMCGSDLKFYRAKDGAASLGLGDGGIVIAGHEPCGVVAEVGADVDKSWLGQRVMDHHYLGCGTCKHCESGWAQMCLEGTTVYGATGHGAHAPYMKVAASTLVPLPEALSFSTGSAISCGTGTAYGALQRLGVTAGATLAIFGQGPVGLSATQLATAMGLRVIALDVGEERLQRAAAFGAEVLIDPSVDDAVVAIRELTDGEGAEFSLDCSAASSARRAALQCVRTWGQACYVGEGGDVTVDVSGDMIRRQVTLAASWTFSIQLQAECAQFIIDHDIEVEKLFTHRYRLEQAEAAYQLFDTQTTGKGVFEF